MSSVKQIPGNLAPSHCKATAMKCPSYKSEKMEEMFAPVADGGPDHHLLDLKFSPVKLEPNDLKPSCPPTAEFWATPSVPGVKASQDKENRTSGFHSRTFEDSGYLTLHNSHIEDCKEDGQCVAAHPGKVSSQQSSPTKGQRRASPGHPTASSHCVSSPLPLLRFHEAVCEELAKDFKKNKR